MPQLSSAPPPPPPISSAIARPTVSPLSAGTSTASPARCATAGHTGRPAASRQPPRCAHASKRRPAVLGLLPLGLGAGLEPAKAVPQARRRPPRLWAALARPTLLVEYGRDAGAIASNGGRAAGRAAAQESKSAQMKMSCSLLSAPPALLSRTHASHGRPCACTGPAGGRCPALAGPSDRDSCNRPAHGRLCLYRRPAQRGERGGGSRRAGCCRAVAAAAAAAAAACRLPLRFCCLQLTCSLPPFRFTSTAQMASTRSTGGCALAGVEMLICVQVGHFPPLGCCSAGQRRLAAVPHASPCARVPPEPRLEPMQLTSGAALCSADARTGGGGTARHLTALPCDQRGGGCSSKSLGGMCLRSRHPPARRQAPSLASCQCSASRLFPLNQPNNRRWTLSCRSSRRTPWRPACTCPLACWWSSRCALGGRGGAGRGAGCSAAWEGRTAAHATRGPREPAPPRLPAAGRSLTPLACAICTPSFVAFDLFCSLQQEPTRRWMRRQWMLSWGRCAAK